jgi:uncharacterized damage-inducible protein DinB
MMADDGCCRTVRGGTMGLGESILAEFTKEAQTTRRMLERLPEGKGDWKPHEKSMTLGRLAMHLAEIPGFFSGIFTGDELVRTVGGREPRIAHSSAEALEAFDASVAAFTGKLKGFPDARMNESWRLKVGDRVALELPRAAAVRAMVLSHSIHHRGQLSVYLRLLNVPVPGAYGPSADDKAKN